VDEYPDDTTWETLVADGEITNESDRYESHVTTDSDFGLDDGKYTFSVHDQYGDGVVTPSGSAALYVDDKKFFEAKDDFGSEASVTFTITGGEVVIVEDEE